MNMKREITDNRTGRTESNETRLLAASKIMSGLLASGHYTFPPERNNDDEPRIIRWDAGKDWKALDLNRRFVTNAVDDALSLLNELEDGLEEQS